MEFVEKFISFNGEKTMPIHGWSMTPVVFSGIFELQADSTRAVNPFIDLSNFGEVRVDVHLAGLTCGYLCDFDRRTGDVTIHLNRHLLHSAVLDTAFAAAEEKFRELGWRKADDVYADGKCVYREKVQLIKEY